MDNKIVTMANAKFGTIRKIVEGESVLYCGADIAKALGYARPNDAISAHCRCTVKRRIPHPQSHDKTLEVSFIPEADVYRLICHSKLPSAMEFEKWVFEDVVPKAVDKNLNPEPEYEQLTLETSEYYYFPKTYNGEPVITLEDFEHFTGVSRDCVRKYIKMLCKFGAEYLILTKTELFQYKVENPGVNRTIKHIIVLKAPAVRKLLKYVGLSVEIPMLAEKKAEIEPAPTTPMPEPKRANTDECIVALNVLRYIKNANEKGRDEADAKGDKRMSEKYEQAISAIDEVLQSVGGLVAAGY